MGSAGVGEQARSKGRPSLSLQSKILKFVAVWLLLFLGLAPTSSAETKLFEFDITLVNFTRNCVTKPLLVVNRQFPGPTLHVSEGDRVIVNVTNNSNTNVTIHWHGHRMWLNNWDDGTGYITQCPIQPGDYKVHEFAIADQRGTTFWHAHISWVRATVYGAFVSHPRNGHPFPKPYKEFPVILGEWWNEDVETMVRVELESGGPFPLADALTINGFPGSQYNCHESEGISIFEVEPGETYLLRIINAAMNTDMFFGVANHELTVVEADANYVKPFKVDKGIFIAVGQTMNVLVTANQPPGTYYIAGKGHSTLLITDDIDVPPPALASYSHDIPWIPTTALFQYRQASLLESGSTYYPVLPDSKDENYSTSFEKLLKSLYHEEVPSGPKMRHLLYTIGASSEPCRSESQCPPQRHGYRIIQSINNISFISPKVSILQAYYYNIPGVFSPDFPDTPQNPMNYTVTPSPAFPGQVTELGTRVSMVEYGTTIELVLQNISNFGFESHPVHLHGFLFHVMGQGLGNFNATTNPTHYNYHDPPVRFTVRSPRQGWVAIRFTADNPGAWLLHCHLEKHTTWGMQTVFIVKSGDGPNQSLVAPPRLNKC